MSASTCGGFDQFCIINHVRQLSMIILIAMLRMATECINAGCVFGDTILQTLTITAVFFFGRYLVFKL